MRASRPVALVLGIAFLSSLIAAAPASAATCSTTDLVPQIRGFSINQGLGSDATLVRGKDIVFRLLLSRPQCADGTTQSVSLRSASLSVKAGPATLLTVASPTNSLTPAPLLSYYKDAPAIPDSTGDPKWIVKGPQLAAAAPAPSTPLTFEATIGYSNSVGGSGTTAAINTFNGSPITKTLAAATTPLRVLAIPMGDATGRKNTTKPQFSSSANTAVMDGFSNLGRTYPVANGTADLTSVDASSTAGMRYHVDTSALLDVSSYMPNGLFCDDGNALSQVIQPQLLADLKQYNAANPSAKSADHVLGVIDQAISQACTEGYADLNSNDAYVRAHYGTQPIMTAALMSMEEGHNFGAVPCGPTTSSTSLTQCPVDRDNASDQFHAPTTWAHSTNVADYPDLAYNLLSPTATNQPVSDDRNAMEFGLQQPGTWLNTNTFLDKDDWAMILCRLGGPTTNDCALPVQQSASQAASQSATTLVGTTDGTKAGTQVFDSYAEVQGATDNQPTASAVHVMQLDASGNVIAGSDQPVRLFGDHSEHVVSPLTAFMPTSKTFSVSYATAPSAVTVELVNTASGEILYRRDKTGGAPRNVHTSVSTTGTTGGCTTGCPPPSEMVGPGQFGPSAQKIDFETNPVTGQAWSPGDVVTGQYLASKGVTFNADSTTTPKIIGACPDNPCRVPDLGTQSGRFSLWNSPNTLPAGPVDPVPDSAGVPLTLNFPQPVQKVGLYMGNDDTNTTAATLTAFDASQNVIKRVTKSNFGSADTTFIGIDAGQNDIASVQLDYGQSPLGEEIDDLTFERGGTPTPSTSYRASVTAEDDNPQNMRAAFFAKCPDSNQVLTAGVKPDSVSGTQASFHYDFDSTQICPNGSTTIILVRLNDGYNQTVFYEMSVQAQPATPPTAVIDNPNAGAQAYSVLQHEPMTLSGQGWDQVEGVLPGSALTWTITGPSGTVSSGQHGNSLTLPAPAGTGGWTPGTYTATLHVVNSAGLSNDTTTTFQVLEDKDNDGIPATVESCYKGSDTNPNDAFGDYDNDGVPNQQDDNPCVAKTTYNAQANFDPNTLNYPSNGGGTSVTVTLTFRYRDAAQIDSNTVYITNLGGTPIAQSNSFKASGWTVKSPTTAVAKFDRQAIINFLCPNAASCQTNQRVAISVAGNAPAGANKPAYSFTAGATFDVQKS
ncbi:MAG: hypothetical protein ABR579_06445 [Actinomycetota bacterium]